MKDQISEEQKADYLDAFNMFDNNRKARKLNEKVESESNRG